MGRRIPPGPATDGVPLHPTQLYEAAALVPVAWLLLRWRARGRPDRIVIGAYFVLAGAIRFAIEFVRVDAQVLGVLTVAHLASLAALAAGAVLLARGSADRGDRSRGGAAADRAAANRAPSRP